jgi:hypothetical protein
MLKRRWLINLGLFVIVLGLALAAGLERQRERSTTTLTAMQPDAIQGLSLQRPGEPLIRLIRDDDAGWRMLEPFGAPAADATIGKLLPISSAFVHRTFPTAALDLHQLGLDPPLISLHLDDLELRFGATEPVDERRYVQIGDMVHLIDDRYLPQLLASAEHYLDRRLLPAGFSPMLGTIDGRPLGAGAVAGLADAEALRVEPLTGALGGRVLTLESADGGKALRFLIDEGGTRWSRLDQRLSYLFSQPPLAEADEDSAEGLPEPFAPMDALGPPAPPNPMSQQTFAPVSDAELLQLRPASAAEGIELLPPPDSAPMRTEKLRPPTTPP